MGTAWHHGAGGGASSNTHVQHYNDLKIKIYGKMDRSPPLEGKPSDFSSLSDFPLCPRARTGRLVLLVRCWDVVWLSGG